VNAWVYTSMTASKASHVPMQVGCEHNPMASSLGPPFQHPQPSPKRTWQPRIGAFDPRASRNPPTKKGGVSPGVQNNGIAKLSQRENIAKSSLGKLCNACSIVRGVSVCRAFSFIDAHGFKRLMKLDLASLTPCSR